MAPALLIRRLIKPTAMPSVLPVIRALLVSSVIEEVATPLMPRPLAEVMLPVLTIVLLPAPVRFTAAPMPDVPPVMSPLLVRPTETALMPCRPPEISLLLVKRVIAPALLMPSPLVEVMRPRLVSLPMAPLLLMPAPSLDTILALASLVSSVISPAATAAPEPPSIRPRSLFSRLVIVLLA